jgi:hypothetical protein
MLRYRTVTICGSMRYYQQMLQCAEKLTMQGFLVDMPFCTKDGIIDTNLDAMHFAKIDRSDCIFVVNTAGYVGASTRNEILYATAKHKQVYYLYPALVSYMFTSPRLVSQRKTDKLENEKTVILESWKGKR